MKLRSLLFESKAKSDTFESFADTREAGAEKIVDNAKKKGGLALLTWHHFKVKLPYYKNAAAGKFDSKSLDSELSSLVKELARGTSGKIKLEQVEFQRLVGKIEVIGELLIRAKNK